MHSMLSLGVLVAALAALAGWAGYLLVRLYRACPIERLTPAPLTHDDPGEPAGTDSDDAADSEDQPSTPQPVA
jgi:hypothetical protein